MRRREFQMEDSQTIRDFLLEMSFGFLATHRDEYPGITPINFVFTDVALAPSEESRLPSPTGALYFHGSRIGQKMRDLQRNPRASFAVAREFALIPSYFTDPELACPATAFFKSVILRGTLNEVEDLEHKRLVLEEFMRKLQPEGGYLPFDLNHKEYRKNIKGVSLVRLMPTAITAKFKFGQNRGGKERELTIQGLENRNRSGDRETLLEMQRCPYHREAQK
ncbi:MAG: pyridoxamine 5'-phosphate oxidase family protein [Leptospiraceae bacterium]|nr:pyridoxamine 5'-phosphate oxidase family protein [Leptospiraceae bacterium]